MTDNSAGVLEGERTGLLFFAQCNGFGGHSAPAVLKGSIMLFRRINVFMAENVSHKIDISSFIIKICAISAAQLMRRNIFHGGYSFCVFFNQIFNGTDRHPFSLHGEEESVSMPRKGLNSFPFLKVGEKRF